MEQTTRKAKFASDWHNKSQGNLEYLVVAVRLPTGAVELITNTAMLTSKVQYYLDNYDENLCMKRVPEIEIVNWMFA